MRIDVNNVKPTDSAKRQMKDHLRHTWLGWLAAFAIVGILVASGYGRLEPSTASNLVLAITALVVIWYTIETTRLRRDAENRSKREATPVFYFDVKLRDTNRMLSQDVHKAGPSVFIQQGVHLPFRFIIINHTSNPAYLKVAIRLKTAVGTGLQVPEKDYGGERVWHITPFFNLDGWFDMVELLVQAGHGASPNDWPQASVTLNVQVDVYDVRGRFIDTLRKEYTVRFDLKGCVVECWPDTQVSQLPPIPPDKKLGKNLLLAELWPSGTGDK